MLNYFGFGLSAFMLMVSLTAGSLWAVLWIAALYLNASSIAESIRIQEIIAKIPDELVAEVYKAIREARP